MDKTEVYIKMADCEEIQSLCKLDWNFWAIMRNGEFETLTCVKGDRATFMNPSFYPVFLPTQDQLQKMVKDETDPYCLVLLWREGGFDDWLSKLPEWQTVGNRKFTSMEQLWLAFCMSEKYGKIWSGTEWIKK